ncbi:hypothetical protein HY78_01440 [Rhizorhabdus wittichii DC-6]|nr:hypothetical protein HY78_01440 [Rhizorhabdus wittichii DC-6]
MPVDMTCASNIKRGLIINEINSFMADQDIRPFCHRAFYRTFNNGDITPYHYDKGGRLISMGDSYQHLSQRDRRLITINGETTIELDIQGSHLTIARAKLGLKFDPAIDIYKIPGIPRSVVKQCVTMTLGKGSFHKDWPSEIVEDFLQKEVEADRIDLLAKHPFDVVKAEVLKLAPFLTDLKKHKINWANLQFLESEAIVNTVHELATVHGVPSLPVHDSLIIPASQRAKAEEVLKRRFKEVVGIEPHLTAK